ncbi:hypothetical protein LOZ48_006779, partial [Ophidiomyces ophidiicola]
NTGHLQPHDLVLEQRGQVAAPVAARPAHALLQELGVVLERGLDLGLGVVLEVRLPAVRDHPAREEVVVVGVELVAPEPPLLVREAVGEGAVLEDARPVRHRAPGQARHAAVHVRRRRAVEVAPLQVQRAQEVPQPLRRQQRRARAAAAVRTAPQPLARRHAAVRRVGVERGQHPLELGGGPGDVVVDEDGDLGAHLGDGAHHLAALVGLGDAEQLDARARGRHGVQHAARGGHVGVNGDEDDLVRLVQQDGADGLLQLGAAALQRGDDDGGILRRQGGTVRRRDRAKGPYC